MITRAVAADALESEVNEAAAQAAAGPTLALGRAKALLVGSFDQSLETQMEFETRMIAASAGTADFKEGVKAFAEKRAANFSGK